MKWLVLSKNWSAIVLIYEFWIFLTAGLFVPQINGFPAWEQSYCSSFYWRTLQGFQFPVLDTLLQAQWQVMDTPTISLTTYGHSLNSSVTSCGHPPRVSVPLIQRILKKKLKVRTKTIYFTIFTMLIAFF